MIVDPSTVASIVLYDGPLMMSSLEFTDPDPDPFEWLEGVSDDDLVCMEFANVSMTMTASVARAWIESAVHWE